MASLLGMGNPLLDISAEVDKELLEKYEVPLGQAILAEDKHDPLFEEMVSKPGVKYIAGGATMNSIRVAQWMLQEAGASAYMGCVGKDEKGDALKNACEADGVKALLQVNEEVPTGTCATLITGVERSLCTKLAAANTYKVEHTKEDAHFEVVKGAKVIYSAGFFTTVCPEAMQLAREEKAKDGKIYAMNLSAPFLSQVPPFKKVIDETIPYCDYLFGNEDEAKTFAEVNGWGLGEDIAEIAKKTSLLPNEKGKKLTVVFTQGALPTIVAYDGKTTEYPIIALPKEQLVDTNGAGDSYVGGFLAGLVKGLSVEECCKAGAYAASVIVQQSGCTFPAKPDYAW